MKFTLICELCGFGKTIEVVESGYNETTVIEMKNYFISFCKTCAESKFMYVHKGGKK